MTSIKEVLSHLLHPSSLRRPLSLIIVVPNGNTWKCTVTNKNTIKFSPQSHKLTLAVRWRLDVLQNSTSIPLDCVECLQKKKNEFHFFYLLFFSFLFVSAQKKVFSGFFFTHSIDVNEKPLSSCLFITSNAETILSGQN